MNRKRLAFAAALLVLLSKSAAADPLPEVTPITESVTLRADSGAELRVPPGFYVPAPAWAALDAELKRAQTAEVRLAAENKSFRESGSAGPGWGTLIAVASSLAAGIVVGAWAY